MKKILVIDNLLPLTEKSRGLMRRADLTVLTAQSAAEALEVHREKKADLVIIDLQLKGMSPEDFCAAIRRDDAMKNTSILVACQGAAAEIDRALRCRANDYIAKPLDPEFLVKKIGQLLNISERKGCRVLLKVSVDGSRTGESFFCTSQNISASGLLLRTEKALEKGDHITCSFFLPGSERIITGAEVVRASAGSDGTLQYGIRFDGLSPAHQGAIENFVNSRGKS